MEYLDIGSLSHTFVLYHVIHSESALGQGGQGGHGLRDGPPDSTGLKIQPNWRQYFLHIYPAQKNSA